MPNYTSSFQTWNTCDWPGLVLIGSQNLTQHPITARQSSKAGQRAKVDLDQAVKVDTRVSSLAAHSLVAVHCCNWDSSMLFIPRVVMPFLATPLRVNHYPFDQ
jgi:hypothetical protein